MSEQVHPKKDRSWLVYRESIPTEMRQGAAKKAITEYFESIGFRQTQMSPSLQFERGALLASLYSPNPRSQKTHITADIVSSGSENLIELVVRINRFGNIPLEPDFDFWRVEIEGLANTVQQGYSDPRLSEYAAERAKWYSIAMMMALLFVALVFSVIAIISVMLFL
ncbi:MAG: hypothetical protein Q9P01_03525 [Anaerolineae bacterium]|nr:hypothetical protein [Anaerolineae bacterium]MDQ7033921.1 hypothetical protein [Anaerolineae bacterium]